MTAAKITTILNYAAAFLATLLAALIGFDWLTFFTPVVALKIVGMLNLLSLTVKAWITTAEQMAKTMVGPQ